MSDYLKGNSSYWNSGYNAFNTESHVFRVYGRILKRDFGLDGKNGERLLDFGCGPGSAMGFFHREGFEVYGVDISQTDLDSFKNHFPQLAGRVELIDPKPTPGQTFFDGQFDLVLAVQCLYYLSDSDLKTVVQNLYEMTRPGGVFYATMMSTKQDQFFENSVSSSDGLRKVDFETGRMKVEDYYVNFTASEEELVEKMKPFERVHVGFYSSKFREDEGTSHHFSFVGQKPLNSGD